jgi:hypothetical protein
MEEKKTLVMISIFEFETFAMETMRIDIGLMLDHCVEVPMYRASWVSIDLRSDKNMKHDHFDP